MLNFVIRIPDFSPRTNQYGMVIFPQILSHPPTSSISRNFLSLACISLNTTNLSSLNLSSLRLSLCKLSQAFTCCMMNHLLRFVLKQSPTSFIWFSPDFVLVKIATNHSLCTFSMPLKILQFFIVHPSLRSFLGWRGFVYLFLLPSMEAIPHLSSFSFRLHISGLAFLKRYTRFEKGWNT